MLLFQDILWIINIIVVVTMIAIIVHDKREPTKTLAWITVVALIPILGLVMYVLFGRSYRKQKIFSRKELHGEQIFEKYTKIQLKELTTLKGEDQIEQNKDIITLMLNNSKALLTLRNKIEILNNGSQAFPSIIKALKQAKESIHIEYYIFEDDTLGEMIAQILMEKAREGVEVRFIYDDVGSWSLSKGFVNRMKEAGVELYAFMPVLFPWFTSKVNYRNHRKIIVIDSKVAFTGGINIAERYMRGTKKGVWRDTHLRIEGESVILLQHIFVTDWFFVSKKQLSAIEKYFVPCTLDDYLPMQIASSGPDSDWASIMQAFFAAISKAKEHIYISSPYFLPNEAILTALKVASLSGVDVRLLVPSRSDSKIVYWASRSYIEELLEAGVNVYFYRKGFNHSKVITIDGVFSSVGTANMDNRSFEDNFEVAALIYDKDTTSQIEKAFINDLSFSLKLENKYWARRSLLHSIYEELARLLSPLL